MKSQQESKSITVEGLQKIIAKQDRNRIKKISNLYWCAGILLAAIMVFSISALLWKTSSWLSNVLIAVGGGLITGLVLYYLTNLRASNANRIVREHEALNKLNGLVTKCHYIAQYYQNEEFSYLLYQEIRNPVLDARKIYEELDEIKECILKIKDDTATAKLRILLPIDEEKIQKYKDKFLSAIRAMEGHNGNHQPIINWVKYIENELLYIAYAIHEPLYERQTQLYFLNKWYF